MYTTTIHPPTFYHHYTTQFFPAAAPDRQPRVGKYGGNNMLLPRSQYIYSFRLTGIILGSLILFFTIILLSTELARLYNGSNNYGRNETNITMKYLMYPGNTIGMNEKIQNRKIENRWMWPWSTATLLFSLIFISAGIFGIISGQRENYSLILTFFILSLLSICLLIFLIATYSTIISGWKSIYGINHENLMTNYTRIDRDLSIVCLSICCILFIILLISMILSGISIDLCTRKNFFEEENEPDNLVNPYKATFGQ
ncbi:unnamed protein product [Rotaria sordida]|uniref:Uncharacterized protein n=1 Tax=Rotaria sordida TaxID=392033 RepID=A0A819N5Q7_9BILA|nr:unnamed protein product [Rotaria sordida]CAF1110417.1 unnamed protein product [Rotaria sordida]CAF1178868.1 unnamed protein product [Rotaria sordida]CAF1230876.1 unnamed protein product [Rotaria sordida]CAF1438857.1 unnamed protein product [Rotaria sordida]